MHILIVDDQASNRELCRLQIKDIAEQVTLLENGQQLVDMLPTMSTLPDVILLDVMMPIKNGFDAAHEIRERFPQHHIPIIFLTALDDNISFEQCLTLGDDFIHKPVEKSVVQAKVQAHYRIAHMHNEMKHQRDELKKFNQHIEYEHTVADSIFSNLKSEMSSQLESISGIDYLSTPTTLFNGDLIVAARRPHGGAYIMIADATGHGLPAAISTLPAAREFFRMAQKGLPLGEMVTELNSVMAKFLPIGMMLAANVFEIKASGLEVAFWGGGLPNGYILNSDGTISRKLMSQHMPLGVLDNKSFEANIEVFQVTKCQRLCCFTDGIIEAKSPNGEQYGYARLEQILSQTPTTIGKIYDSVRQHSESAVDDDLSILLLDFPLQSSADEQPEDIEGQYSLLPSHFSVCFDANLLQEVTVMNEVRNALHGVITGSHLDLICTALSELFSNAIDHGLLELDSDIKQAEDGFFLYFQQRQERLSHLSTNKWVTLSVTNHPKRKETVFEIEHNGKGFDHSQVLSDLQQEKAFGRGISIVQGLCKSIVYSKGGRCAIATYAY